METAADGSSPGGGRRPVVQGQGALRGQVGEAERERRDGTGGGNAREGADAREGLAEEVRGGLGAALSVVEHLQRHRVPRGEAEVDVHQPHEALHEEARADQEHEGEGDLGRHQRAAQPLLGRGVAGAVPSGKGAVDVLPEHPDGGRAAERQGGEDDEAGGEPEEPLVHRDLREARHVGRHQRHQQVERVRGCHEAAEAAEGRDDHALGQELAQQASGPPAHCGADRELLLAPRVAGQHEVGDVDAGDEEDEDHGAPQQEQHRAHRCDLTRLQGDDARADAGVGARMVGGEPGRDGVHLGLGLGQGDGGAGPGDHLPPAAVSNVALVLGDGLGEEDVAVASTVLEAELEGRREDPHDRVRLVVQHQRPADDGGVAVEAAPPELVRHDDHAAARPVLVGHERAPAGGNGTERLEEPFRDLPPVEHLGRVGAGEVDRPRVEGGDVLEARRLLAPVEEVRGGDLGGPVAVLGVRLPQRDETLRLGKGRRLQQHRVDHREGGGGRADREGQGQDRGRGEPRVPPQDPQDVADVLQRVLEGGAEPRVANVVPGRLETAEGRQRLPPRFVRRGALRSPGLGLERDVVAQLVVQLAVDAVPAEKFPQPDPPCVQPLLERHDPPPAVSPASRTTKGSMVPVIRSYRLPCIVHQIGSDAASWRSSSPAGARTGPAAPGRLREGARSYAKRFSVQPPALAAGELVLGLELPGVTAHRVAGGARRSGPERGPPARATRFEPTSRRRPRPITMRFRGKPPDYNWADRPSGS